jgi:hypothetical protein
MCSKVPANEKALPAVYLPDGWTFWFQDGCLLLQSQNGRQYKSAEAAAGHFRKALTYVTVNRFNEYVGLTANGGDESLRNRSCKPRSCNCAGCVASRCKRCQACKENRPCFQKVSVLRVLCTLHVNSDKCVEVITRQELILQFLVLSRCARKCLTKHCRPCTFRKAGTFGSMLVAWCCKRRMGDSTRGQKLLLVNIEKH